jgi:hypothetical protein
MTASARHSRTPDYDSLDGEYAYVHGELLPGERAGPPLARRGRKALLRGLLILIVLGGGWMLVGDRTNWPEWSSIEPTVMSWINRMPGMAQPATLATATTSRAALAQPPAKPAAVEPLPPIATTTSPAERAQPPPTTMAALPPAAKEPEERPGAPLPPPAADPADPYRIRAEAVGLHPDLSRVLLDRMSPADYRNAGYAVETALAKTADTEVFVWPRQRKPELALFQVRFVPGAAPGCRRYVVTVTKDGWLTTALPMERCSPQPKRAQRG